MKKILTLFAVVGLMAFTSCSNNDDYVDTNTISEVFEIQNVNFTFDNQEGYLVYQSLDPILFDKDVILIYRFIGTTNSGAAIWQQIPRTVYTDFGDFDYDFDFSRQDFTIYAGGNYDLALTPQFIRNQTFRIVIVPGSSSGIAKSVNKEDYSDYYAVIKKYGIDDSNVKVLNK